MAIMGLWDTVPGCKCELVAKCPTCDGVIMGMCDGHKCEDQS